MKPLRLPILIVWVLSVLTPTSLCLAHDANAKPEFGIDHPILPVIHREAWADPVRLTLPMNQTVLRVVADEPRPSPQNLTYHWMQLNGPPMGRVEFSPNNGEDASMTTATFTNEAAGPYTFRVIVSNGIRETISEVEFTLDPSGPHNRNGQATRHGRAGSVGRGKATGSPAYKIGRSGDRSVTSRVDRIIVRFESDLTTSIGESPSAAALALSSETRDVLSALGATLTRVWCGGRLGLVSIDPSGDLESALEALTRTPEIRYAVPDHSVTLNEFIPNDPQFGSQWPLANAANVDIEATLAWDQTTGTSDTLVAVMDTGVDYTHPDLYLAVAINNAEIPLSLSSQIVETNVDGRIDFYDLNSLDGDGNPVVDGSGTPFNETLVIDHNGNGRIDAGDLLFSPWSDGVDGDGNGYIDDLTGWDYVGNDHDPMDTYGHGTHVAGIIAARGNNDVGIAGVNWRTRILVERFHDGGGGNISELIDAIDHAVSLGVDVINASWGTFVDNLALKDAISWAGDNGAVFVAAAGNQSNDMDSGNPYYPAAYTDLLNLISVASIDPDGSLSSFSNFGATTVDIAAPGASVLSAGLGGGYVLWSGTSMATPHVAGVVALLAGLFPSESPQGLRDRILSTAAVRPELAGLVATGGVLDAFSAIDTPSGAGPRIVAADPVGDVQTQTDRVLLTFDNTMNVGTFASADVTIDGPDGPVLPVQVNQVSAFQYELTFPVQASLGTYHVAVGPDIEDTLGRLMDQDRDGIIGESPDDRFQSTFRQIAPPAFWIVDNGDAGFDTAGSWSTYVGAGLQGDFAYKPAGDGTGTATWTVGGLTPGQYYVAVTWQAFSNRAVDAPYTILDGTAELATVNVDQRQTPSEFFEGGQWWQTLAGPYTITGGTLVVRLDDLAGPVGSRVIADAVRVESVESLPPAPEITVSVNGTAVADGTGSLDFGGTAVGTPTSRIVTVRNAGTADLTLGTISVPSGFTLLVDIATTTLTPGQETIFVVQLDATTAGSYAGTISFGTNDADENPFDFAVTGTVTDGGISQVWIVDDGDNAYNATGGWTTYAGGGLQGDFAYKVVGSGASTATWTFTGLTPGQYYVSATWQAYSNRPVDATYTILDGVVELASVPVDQRQTPADFFEDQWWQDLGGVHTITGDTLVVRLSDLASPAGSKVVADAIRVGSAATLPPAPEIAVLVNGTAISDGTGSVDFGGATVGAPVTRTVTVRNVGTADLTLGTISVPAGFTLVADVSTSTIGPGLETTFTVQLDAVTAGAYAGTVTFGTNDSDENPYDFTVTGTATDGSVSQVWTADNGDAGYGATGGWSTYTGVGLLGDFAYKQVGSGAESATWTFTGLTPGQYYVSATWQAYSNRAIDAPYTILDGASEIATVLVDQRQTPVDFFDDGEWWQDLGDLHTITGDTLVVQLTDLAGPAGGYLIADGVRIERVADSPSGPEIMVSVGGLSVADGTGSVDFGSTVEGVPVTRIVTVRNAGTADLSLGAIAVPAGFTLTVNVPTTTLTPGQETSFEVQLDAAAIGAYAGTISFDTNDADESPFNFDVAGTVTEGTLTTVWVQDDGDAGFDAVGGWTPYSGSGMQGDLTYKLVGSGTATATWTFTGLAPGQYYVSATWLAFSNRPVDVPYTILDGTTELATVLVDQTQAPADLFDVEWWHHLGGLHTVTGDTLVVRLSDLASPTGSYVIADGVRVERVGGVPSLPEIEVLVGGTAVQDGPGSVDFGGSTVGLPLTRIVTVRNTGTAELTLGAIAVPAGYTLVADVSTTTVAPGQETTFTVQLDAVSAGTYTGTVSFDTNDSDENPFDFTVTGIVTDGAVSQVWTLDNGDAGYAESGGWSAYSGVGLQGDFAYKQVGGGAALATWTFTGLSPGQYYVSATWESYSNRAIDAPYTVLDGTTELVTVLVNQRQAPADFFDVEWWQDLGSLHTVTGDTLVVRLSDLAGPAGGYVIADGIRIERIADPPSGPEVAVLVDGSNIPDGTGSVDFGSTLLGVPVNRIVTVRNVGTTDLTLGTINVSAGFTLVAGISTTTLAPSEQTSFEVQLDADLVGTSAGLISFGTNDADENPFDFNVTGTITDGTLPQVWTLDDGDAGYSTTGAWSTYTGVGLDGDFAYKQVGVGSATATWTFGGLTPGQYRVSATWQSYSNRVAGAPYTILDGVVELATVPVDQRQPPAGFFDLEWWQDLGGLYLLTGNTLVVELSDLAGPAGSYIIADGVRVERVGDLP